MHATLFAAAAAAAACFTAACRLMAPTPTIHLNAVQLTVPPKPAPRV